MTLTKSLWRIGGAFVALLSFVSILHRNSEIQTGTWKKRAPADVCNCLRSIAERHLESA